MQKNNKGFTLIELLVVIAIIGLLATLAIVSLRSAQQKARDTKRITDAKSMQTAVELYYSENSAGYPVPTSWSNFNTLLAPYVTSLPQPPDDADAYVYGVNSAQDNYVIAVTPGLEDANHQALSQDAPDGTYGASGTTENWGAGGTYIASDGTAGITAVSCTDPIYCLVE